MSAKFYFYIINFLTIVDWDDDWFFFLVFFLGGGVVEFYLGEKSSCYSMK